MSLGIKSSGGGECMGESMGMGASGKWGSGSSRGLGIGGKYEVSFFVGWGFFLVLCLKVLRARSIKALRFASVSELLLDA